MALDVAKIEERLDKTAAGGTLVSDALGGVIFKNMLEVMEFSKLMSMADVAIPKHLRSNPGACLRIVTQALEWRMSPFAVADKSYSVSDRISYESQLVHAVIEQRAPLLERLKHRFEGEGDERICIVWAKVKGEEQALEWTSPPFAKITPKNSPLWKTKPDLQQYYNTSRDWCRVYFPDVLLGVYSEDELDGAQGPERAKDVTPKPTIGARLAKKAGDRGFDAAHVERHTTIEATEVRDADPAVDVTERDPSPDPRAVAYEAGEEAREKGLALRAVPGDLRSNKPLADAWQDGWRARDKAKA